MRRKFLPLSWKGFAFEPFQVPSQGIPLASLDLPAELELIVFSQGGLTRALVAREMAYHHVAQGELCGHPYMVSFCPPCNSGVGLTPVINDQVYHFGAIGLSNGLAVLADRETRTHWDHITGEAIAGPLAGHQLEVWPVRMTTVVAALAEDRNITISISGYRSFKRMLAQKLYPSFIHEKIWLPKFFSASMNAPIDSRLDKLTQGLGVVVGRKAKYYPIDLIPSIGLDDIWLERNLHINRGAIDGVPRAKWKDTEEEPMQLLTRWYGFSFTYPQCDIYEPQTIRSSSLDDIATLFEKNH